MSTGDKLILVLDVGTTELKACLVDSNGTFRMTERRTWQCRPVPGVPNGLTFSPVELMDSLFEIVRVISERAAEYICGIIVSTQRLGFVYLDEKGRPMDGLPNIDRRAFSEAGETAPETNEEAFRKVGRWIGAQHLKTRIQWWKRHEAEAFSRVAYIVSIGSFVTYALTGRILWDPTTACETGFLDIQTQTWREDALQELGLSSRMFGDPARPGELAGALKDSAVRMLGLKRPVPVFMGGGYTQLGILGAGGIHPGDAVVVAGSSAPVNLVLDKPEIDGAFRMITNPHVIGQRWVMEANAMMTGITFQWAKGLLWEDAEDGYQKLNDLARKTLLDCRSLPEMVMIAGPSLANARLGNTYQSALLKIGMNELYASSNARGAVAFSAFESVVYAILGNVDMLSAYAGTIKHIYIGGGETRLHFLVELLSALSSAPVLFSDRGDLTCLGAAILAFTGLGAYDSVEEAVRQMACAEEQHYHVPHEEELRQRKGRWISTMEAWRILQKGGNI